MWECPIQIHHFFLCQRMTLEKGNNGTDNLYHAEGKKTQLRPDCESWHMSCLRLGQAYSAEMVIPFLDLESNLSLQTGIQISVETMTK